MRLLLPDLRREVTKRRAVVQNGEAAAVCRNHEVGWARMKLNVVHAHRRNIADADPMSSLIDQSENSEMRAGIEQLRVHEIFANALDRIVRRQIAAYRLPGFAEIARAQNHRAIVA